jgi:hypothetical protein
MLAHGLAPHLLIQVLALQLHHHVVMASMIQVKLVMKVAQMDHLELVHHHAQ